MKTKHLFILVILIFSGISLFPAQVELELSVTKPYLIADTNQNVFLKVGLTGFELANKKDRPPVNVCVVLDRSGSMDGEKISRAKEAAKMALNMLGEKDVFSLVTYSDTVSVIVPASYVSEKNAIRKKINDIYADGSTALFAGVSKGADELSRYFDDNKVNRIVLLSDGLANVGPDSPMALGNLGHALKKSGISVTTIGLGLGYNEDLMVQLAKKSDGNHAFVENYNDLVRIFEYEFNDILSVVAKDVDIEIICPDTIKPVRILGRDADIYKNKIITNISQLYSKQEKYLLVELEVQGHGNGSEIDLANVKINYSNLENNKTETLNKKTRVAFTSSHDKVNKSIDSGTMVEAVKQISAETNEKAIELRDEGRKDEAQLLLQQNTDYLLKEAEALESEELKALGTENESDAEAIKDDDSWSSNRKKMRAKSYGIQSQQTYDNE